MNTVVTTGSNNEFKVVNKHPYVALEETNKLDFLHSYGIEQFLEYLQESIKGICRRTPYGTSLVTFVSSKGYYDVRFYENNYFKATVYDEFNGNMDCMRIIAALVCRQWRHFLHLPYIQINLIKQTTKHLKDIIYWAIKYKISEVFDFIRNILTFKHPQHVKLLNTYDYIMLNGGVDYFKKNMLELANERKKTGEYFAYPEKIQSLIRTMNNEFNKCSTKFDDEVKFLIAKHKDLKIFGDDLLRYSIRITLERINYRRSLAFFKTLDESPELGIELLVNPTQKVYSHFLWAHTKMIENHYSLQVLKLPNIDFYNDLLSAAQLLPEDLATMLKANLYVLNQNN